MSDRALCQDLLTAKAACPAAPFLAVLPVFPSLDPCTLLMGCRPQHAEPGLTPRVQELVLAPLLAGLVPVQLGLEMGTFHFFLCFPIPFIVLG